MRRVRRRLRGGHSLRGRVRAFRRYAKAAPQFLRTAAAVDHGLPIAAEMGPAELPPWQPLVGAVAVANQDTRKITAQQGTHAVAIAVVADQEDGQVSRNADPQPSLARLLFPGSLVSMNHGRLAELRVG